MIGVQILITGLLGIPPVNGLIPQAPLHTDSLCDKKFVEDADGKKIEVIVGCHEQRVSGLSQALGLGFGLGLANPNSSPSPNPNPYPNPNPNLSQAVLIGLPLAAISVVGLLPIAALDGLFLYMGIASFGGSG